VWQRSDTPADGVLALNDTDLVAQRQNLQLERGAAPERGRKGGKQGRE
jgi:hypothetical protein